MSPSPLVSIIIPIYKVERYVERCIMSVLCQTYRHLEVILVDDCTPDRSMEIARSVISDYLDVNVDANDNNNVNDILRFVYLRHEHNRGLSAARNTGTDAATGDYIYYLDSDDELTENGIEILCEEVRKRPNVEMVQGMYKLVPYKEGYYIKYDDIPLYVDDNKWIRYHYFYIPRRKIKVTAWNKLILRSFISEHHISFMEGLIHEDELWMFEIAKVLCRYSIATEVTYIHYSTEGSIMNTEDAEQRAYHWNVILNEALHKMNEPFLELQLLTYAFLAKSILYTGDRRIRSSMIKIVFQLVKHRHYRIAFYFIVHYCLYPHAGGRLSSALDKALTKYDSYETVS